MRLQVIRKRSGKTQVQVAKEASVGERLYQDYEHGKHIPSVIAAIRIAKALGSTVEELFGPAAPKTVKTPGESEKPARLKYHKTGCWSIPAFWQQSEKNKGGKEYVDISKRRFYRF